MIALTDRQFTCYECGGDVAMAVGDGRTMPYPISNGHEVQCEVPANFPLDTCMRCGAVYLCERDCELLDEVFREQVLQIQLHERLGLPAEV
jgi:hypothetical protein